MTKQEYMTRHGLTLRRVTKQDRADAITDDQRRADYIISDGKTEWYSLHGSLSDLREFVNTAKYARLTDDLRGALAAGMLAEAADPEDGGACNFDAAAIHMPAAEWNAARVEQAAKAAGTYCYKWDVYGARHFVFTPRTRSQGNARSRNAEAMTRHLRAAGYDAMDYCQMD